MNSLMAKYFREAQNPELHGGMLVGHSPDGFPVRGNSIPQLTQREYEEMPLVCDFKCRLFKTWEPEDMVAYQGIMDRVSNGHFYIKTRLTADVPEQGGWRIWLEWVQVYGQPRLPTDAIEALPDPTLGFNMLLPGGGP
jgi:hypothetical protein